jgi:hypothetical protein
MQKVYIGDFSTVKKVSEVCWLPEGRLCRLMCGKSLTFRTVNSLLKRLRLQIARRSLTLEKRSYTGKAKPYRTSGGKAARFYERAGRVGF